jgi:hypothetical protein
MAAARDDNKVTHLSDSAIDTGEPRNDEVPATRGHITLREAARRLGISSREVRQMLAAGQLAGYWGRDENGAATAYVRTDAVEALTERIQTLRP